MTQELSVIGTHVSYFTGKLESYLRAKGLPYRSVPFSMESLERAAGQTGFFQAPQVECPDGSWLVDTTPVIDYLDRLHPEPRTSPTGSAANFIALLLEDYADEWLWRPAMHYRWSFPNSAELLSSWLAEHNPDAAPTRTDIKAAWIERQKGTFVDGDGVSENTRMAVESSYLDALTSLESIFSQRDFIMGDRPCQADFGFMGPFFRHFSCDPDPGRIMRDTAPGVLEWVARMWNMRPSRFENAVEIEKIPDGLGPLLEPISETYLPYLLANQRAIMSGAERVRYKAMTSEWNEPAKPYRLWCLDELRRRYSELDEAARDRVAQALASGSAQEILSTAPTGHSDDLAPMLPIMPRDGGHPFRDSWGRSAP